MPGPEAVIRSALELHFGLAFWQRREKLALALVWVALQREPGTVLSVQHLFCSIRGNAILDSHPDSTGARL
jgi:hypothetical protein